MRREMLWIFGVVFALFVAQSIGTWFQIRDYQRAVRRLHRKGTVGVGQKKGFAGHIALLVCDGDGVIIDAEAMEGITILSRFRTKKELLGRTLAGTHILDLIADFLALEQKRRKYYRGYIQAAEALEKRLYPEEYEGRIAAGQILIENRSKKGRFFRFGG